MPQLSKIEQCTIIADANPDATRQQLIALFMEQVPNISPGGASTYASSVRKSSEARVHLNHLMVQREQEPEAQIAVRLEERFRVIDALATASTLGRILSLVISGPAGLGKTYTTEQAIRAYDPDEIKTRIVKGMIRATGLYLLLHEFRHKGNVLVLDDADSIFMDQDALNLLKVACDTTEKRYVSWHSETKMEDQDGNPIDRTFEFNGTIIFITNKDFDVEIAKGAKNAEHYEALISRSHYVECDMHSERDYIVRIKQVVGYGMLRDQKGLPKHAEDVVLKFIVDNSSKLRELTLRMALKLSDVYLMDPANFETLARISCFKRGVV